MNVLKEYDPDAGLIILEQYSDPLGNEYYFLMNEATREVSFTTKSKGAVKGFKDFLIKHPYMSGMAVAVGLSAIDTYRSNKRLTTRFFATSQIERELYKKIADDLAATGKYTIVKKGKRIHNGWLWELKRKGV